MYQLLSSNDSIKRFVKIVSEFLSLEEEDDSFSLLLKVFEI